MISYRKVRRAFSAYAGVPFEYGVMDCCQFAAKMVKDIHGVDYAAQFPAYTSVRGALKITKKYGGVKGLADSVLGESRSSEDADDGDVVLCEFPEVGPALGIACNGYGWFKTEGTVVPVPLYFCEVSWPVCHKHS